MKKLLGALAALLLIGGLWTWNSPGTQDWLLDRLLGIGMNRAEPMAPYDGMRVLMCGTSSPLPARNRAQACVAVIAGEDLYLVDVGAGSTLAASLARLPMDRVGEVGAIRGVVWDSIRGRGLSDATVSVFGTRAEARTDAFGRFYLPDVPAGARRLTFVHDDTEAWGLGGALVPPAD